MVFYQGQWRTPEAIARKLETRTDNDRRVFDGQWYLMMASRPFVASVYNAHLTAKRKERIAQDAAHEPTADEIAEAAAMFGLELS